MSAEELPNLDTFAKAAEVASFTAAARTLGLTQAAVSQRIAALEKSLGIALFRRRGGRVLLTDAGRELFDYSQRILALHREARARLTGQKAPVAGELSLAASSIPGEYLLPRFLALFQESYPHVRVRATVTDTKDVLDQIEQGRAHLGLVGNMENRAHLEFRTFATDELVVVQRRGQRVRGGKKMSVQQLRGQPLILREPGSGSRACLEAALKKAGSALAECSVVLELGSNEAIKEAVAEGLGLAILSKHAVDKEVKNGRFHTVRVTGVALTRDLYAVWDTRRGLPVPAQLFRDLLLAQIGA